MKESAESAVNNGIRDFYKHQFEEAIKYRDVRNDIKEAFSSMSEYRLIVVRKLEGVTFIDDSRAISVNAAWWALDQTHGPIVWIAGCEESSLDYSDLLDVVKKKVKILIPLGKDNQNLRDTFSGVVPMTENFLSMDQAVLRAKSESHKRSTVLLAPTCASFDSFRDWKHLSWEFRKAVRKHT